MRAVRGVMDDFDRENGTGGGGGGRGTPSLLEAGVDVSEGTGGGYCSFSGKKMTTISMSEKLRKRSVNVASSSLH